MISTNGQLDQAIAYHQKGDLTSALEAYVQILNNEKPPLPAFLNASSLWRSDGKTDLAIKCLKRGIDIYPEEAGLWNNLGNCYVDEGIQQLAISSYRRALTIKPEFADARISLSSSLRELGYTNLAYAVLKNTYFLSTESDEDRNKLQFKLLEAALSLHTQDSDKFQASNFEKLAKIMEETVQNEVGVTDPCRAWVLMAQLWLNLGQLDKARRSLDQLTLDTNRFLAENSQLSLKQTFFSDWHSLNWNLGILLLKKGRLKEGWKLFEHGLQVEASGPQRWQRALKKPFTPSEVALWRGENLHGKRLLLLGEQGIGDTMMFASLIPRLQKEGADITLFPGNRLIEIYKRSFPDLTVISPDDLKNGHLSANDFDMQSPLGSICQYRFAEISDYGPKYSVLTSDQSQTSQLRKRYNDGRPLVGISWQGGGKPNRIPQKSLKLKQLIPILQSTNYRFVSLQYGDDGPHLEKFYKTTGIEVLHDDTIDPLRDMDGWLSQVGAMDAVISIANTTVHGAGGLGIPTLCFVSQQSDWRWIDPDIHRGCYWYPSVDACYQDQNDNWQSALDDARNWLERHLSKSLSS